MTGLAEVLAAHVQVSGFDETGVWHSYGCDCSWTGASDAEHHAHVAAAVTAWLAERLGSEEVREAVRRKVTGFVCNVSNLPEPLQVPALGLNMTPVIDGTTDAALAAVVGALGVES